MESLNHTSKICSTCNLRLLLTEFYQIKSKEEKSARWEKTCKTCKQEALKSKRLPTKPDDRATPSSHLSDRFKQMVETAAKSDKYTLDCSHWEQRYGKQLNQEDREEIYTNLTSFFNLLAEEVLKK